MHHTPPNQPNFLTALRAPILAAAALGAPLGYAQNSINTMPPSNVVQLSSQGSVEVQQDVLRITLRTTKQGSSAQQVQTQLKQAIDAALKTVRSNQQGNQFRVRTGQFSVYPMRNQRNQKISNWQGDASVIVSGTDMARVSRVAGKISSMAVAHTDFGISPELRKKTETKAQAQAIADFRSKAQTITRQFGFGKYNLRAVTVQSENQYGGRMMAYAADANMKSRSAAAPIPTQPGKTTIRVQVRGSVQMQ